MDDPLPVRPVEGVRDLKAVPEHLIERERPFHQPIRQRLPLEVLHDEELDAVLVPDVVERADVRMRELRDRLRLPLEPLADLGARGEVRGQDFDGNRAAEARVAGAVDLAHAAGADLADDLVRAEAGAGGERHGFRAIRGSASSAPERGPPGARTQRAARGGIPRGKSRGSSRRGASPSSRRSG